MSTIQLNTDTSKHNKLIKLAHCLFDDRGGYEPLTTLEQHDIEVYEILKQSYLDGVHDDVTELSDFAIPLESLPTRHFHLLSITQWHSHGTIGKLPGDYILTSTESTVRQGVYVTRSYITVSGYAELLRIDAELCNLYSDVEGA